MANCSSNHLPFTLRYRVELHCSPEARGGEGGREEKSVGIVFLSLPVTTNVVRLVERSGAERRRPSLESEGSGPHLAALPDSGGPLLAAMGFQV